MSSPPTPPYPKNCGKAWDKTQTVTGEIYGKGGFGREFKKTLSPIGYLSELNDIGKDGARIDLVKEKLGKFATRLSREIDNASGRKGTKKRLLNSNEERALRWLLEHAQSQWNAAESLWEKWVYRRIDMGAAGTADGGTFPLNLEDRTTNIPGGGTHCAGRMGKWIPSTSPRGGDIFCPTLAELQQRPKDRAAIRQHLIYAFENIRCAQVGLYRMLLYKQALAAWKGLDLPQLATPTEPGTPELGEPLVLGIPEDLDLCEAYGIGCEEDGGIQPPPVEPLPPGNDDCPSEWCFDPDGLPDPGLGEIGPELPPQRPEKPGTKRALSDATAGLLVVFGAGVLYAAGKILSAR